MSTRRAARRSPLSSRSTRTRVITHDVRFDEVTDARLTDGTFFCSVHHISREVERDEKASEKKQELKKLREEQKLNEEPLARVAGKLTYESLRCYNPTQFLTLFFFYSKLDRETPVAFSEELTGNMRTLKPKGNPLLDRFDSLHKRNMIEIGGPRQTRKRKVRIIDAKK